MAAVRGPFGITAALGLSLFGIPGAAKSDPVSPRFPASISRALPSPVDRWQTFIAEASARFGIPQAWIRAVMQVESGGRTILNDTLITSPAGAMGLMQVMPDTYAEMRKQYHLGADPYNPRDNILAGTAFLREMYGHYGYPELFAAYNAGPARLDADLHNGEPLPGETVAYLNALGQYGFTNFWHERTASKHGNFDAISRTIFVQKSDLKTGLAASNMPGLTPSATGLFVSLAAGKSH